MGPLMPFLSSGPGFFFPVMKHRSLLVSLAALVSLCAIAADTATDIGLINDGSTVITAVDHTKLINGTTEVRANTNGTASVVYDSIVLHVPSGFKYGGASMTKTGDIEFYGPRAAGGFNALWVPVGESFDSYVEPGSGNLVLVSASLDQPAVVYLCDDLGSFIYSISGWNTDSPSLARCGDSVYSGGDITIGKKVERTMATTDQIPSVPTLATVATSGSYNDLLNKPTNVSAFNNDAGYVDAQTATNIVTGSVPAWARSNKKPTYSYSEIQSRPNSIGGFIVVTNIVDGEVVGAAMVYPDHEQSGIFVAPFGGIELSAEHDDDMGWFVGIGLSQTNDFASKAWVRDQGYVPASTATNIAKQIIRSAVANVNVNLQSAEDTRVALTNLITILKNL